MRLLENLDVQFVSLRRRGYAFSAVLILISLVALFGRGLELGIDFKGGMEFVVEVDEDLAPTVVRSDLADVLGAAPEVKSFGPKALLVRAPGSGTMEEVQRDILTTVAAQFPTSAPRIVKSDVVGPRFAQDLKRGAIYSVIGSLLVIFVYILIRFEWRYGLGAVMALFHDVTITLGLFALLRGFVPFSLQIDQAIIAAFLTIVGYSLNDTVVIFDRIREYSNLFKTQPFEDVVDRSINRTMSRTIITSGTTLLVVVVLFIFGGEVLKGFAFALIGGIAIGTYSSVFVASPIVVELRQRFPVKK